MQIYFSFCFAWSWNIFLALSYWSVDKIEKCLLTLWSDVLVSSWCRRIWQHFLIPQLAVCPSRHCWPGNWPSGSSLSIRPLTNAIKGLLQTLPLPTTTKSFRFSNYTKFCQMSNLLWVRTARTMWCEHRRPGAGWEVEMLQLCWIQIHEICSVDAEAENTMYKQQESFGASGTIDHLHQNQCIDLVLVMPPGTAGFSQSIKRGLLLQFEFASSRVRWNLRWSKTVDPARQSSRSGLRNFKFKDATL